MVVNSSAKSASLYGGEGNDSFQMALMTSGLAEGGSGADTFVLSGSLKGGSIYGGAAGASSDGADLMSIAGGISAGAVYGNQGNDSLVVSADANESNRLWWFR